MEVSDNEIFSIFLEMVESGNLQLLRNSKGGACEHCHIQEQTKEFRKGKPGLQGTQ